jgi:NAD dependent epimerase/dehydratase
LTDECSVRERGLFVDMNLRSKNILVTGADGFIGSHLTEELVRRNLNVRALVLYNSFNSWGWLDHVAEDIRKQLNVFLGDIRDPHDMKKLMEGCDVVFHLAALIAIPYSYRSPASYVDTNVRGTLNVLQAALEMGVERVIHTSTSEVYGTARFVPITEQHPLQGQSPYSASKIGADHIAMSYHASYDAPIAIIRPFNTYGPRQSARAVIPTIITQIASGKKHIKLGALHPTRDFSYIKDVVNGFISVAESDKAVGEIINIGSNSEISIGDTAKIIAETMEIPIKVETDPNRIRPAKSEVERLWADNSKAQELTGWVPAYRGIEGFRAGIKETVGWFKKPDNLKLYKADLYNI